MEVNQAAVSRYCAAEQKQEHRRAIQEVVQTINSIHSKLEKEMSEEAGSGREAAASAPRSKTDAYGASFVFVLPQNHTRLEE